MRKDMLKVFIDGFELNGLYQLDINTYDIGGYGFVDNKANVKVTLTAFDGTSMTFVVEGKEQIGNTVYFYGPLRKLFPDIFRDDLLPWQVSYLEYSGKASLDRFKVKSNDPMFETVVAKAYFAGFDKGFTAGGVNERKLALIADKELKNPTSTQKAVAKKTKQDALADFANKLKAGS